MGNFDSTFIHFLLANVPLPQRWIYAISTLMEVQTFHTEVAGFSETAHTLAACNLLDSIRTTIQRFLAYCCLNAIREWC